ncbi:HIT family protein [Paenibacillus sp. 1001270B_150601_E10]|uniref:HIT family protein n=1 Tax=Paenibacillus sp. 1001270B_150601_E10 TaxID=2787079 RepID=UPI00189F56D1|nr:HIT family protein [Paenibacillus sp. 1001270B_150601_E10]
MECLGCSLANQKLSVHVVWEDNHVCCFLDHNPYNEGHVLILPKNHARYVDDLCNETTDSLMKASKLITKAIKKLYKPDGITICQNGGAFDDLTHFHMHIIPRYEGQNFAEFYEEDPEAQPKDNVQLAKTKIDMINTLKVLD